MDKLVVLYFNRRIIIRNQIYNRAVVQQHNLYICAGTPYLEKHRQFVHLKIGLELVDHHRLVPELNEILYYRHLLYTPLNSSLGSL
jgi:hypothetical protein